MTEPAILFLAFALAAFAPAQTSPVLHSRGEVSCGTQTRAAKGSSTLPDNASGEYELDERGSVIQITIERNRLSGYVTQMEQGIEQGTALTLFFDRTTLDGNHLSFTSSTVHGMRYSFKGTIVRGDAAAPSLTGFYRLTGDLIAERNGTRRTEHVSLKSTPRPADRQ